MNNKKYFIVEDEVQKGPFSFNELKEIGISKSTFIWKEGLDDWTKAKKIEELQSLFNITPPKLPKKLAENIEKDKTLNVNLAFGKPKTSFELKEKELAKEKFKASIANTILYYLKNGFIAIFIFGVFLYIYSISVNSDDALNVHDPSVVENYYRVSGVFNFVGYIILIVCFYIVFHRPMKQIYNWFKKYSEKEI